ncbi:hypothetical protein ACFC08_28460 [Streptomyces sp. NPDC056112]|uniref:hypothetical protein n=1 Tax=Streptomyces sp. NPDC056112 TaxID=3345715 RepID=UPI0035DF3180
MTHTPAPAAPDRQPDPDRTPDADQPLADVATSSGEYLAGLIAAGALDAVGQPAKLPELLFPHIPAEHVREVWEAALPVGYRAGRRAGRPRFNRADLSRLQQTLEDAGYKAMAGLAARTAATIPAQPAAHPADLEQGLTHGEHW